MNIRLHISRPDSLSPNPPKRVWILPHDICQKCALLLWWNPKKPSSISIRKWYKTQSEAKIPLTNLLSSLWREYIEVPAGKEIHYRRALMRWYEYLFEEIDGAWSFDSVPDILLGGYTHEKTTPDNGSVYSIWAMRKMENIRSDGGTRYLFKYIDEKKKYTDIYDVLDSERDPETAQKIYDSSDELAQMIF